MARRPNRLRIESMVRWYEVARAEFGRPIDSAAAEELAQEVGFPAEGVPIARQIKVMLVAQRHYLRMGQVDNDRFVLPDVEAWLDAIARDLDEDDDLYSCDMQALRAFAATVALRMLRPAGISGKRDITMKTYEVAASLFNAQLQRDQANGLRQDEQTVTKSAIQRAIARLKNSV